MTLTREHFEARYAADPDPWDFEGSAYERAKYERTLAALGERRYASAFEAGCSIGVFTAMLADRCDELLAVDIAQSAVDATRRRLVACLQDTWQHAGRWAGPADDPGFAAVVAAGMVGRGPSEQRELVRRWLVDLLAAEGLAVELPEPDDWSGWDPVTRRWTP